MGTKSRTRTRTFAILAGLSVAAFMLFSALWVNGNIPVNAAIAISLVLGVTTFLAMSKSSAGKSSQTRVLRNVTVYAAGFLPFALFWRSIGVVPSVLVGVVAMVVVALIFRRHDAKSRAPQTLHQSTEQKNQ
jgi:CBS-domain-containing membrane protein